jgi:hypothetical protein
LGQVVGQFLVVVGRDSDRHANVRNIGISEGEANSGIENAGQ